MNTRSSRCKTLVDLCKNNNNDDDFMHRPSTSIEENYVFNVSGDEHSDSFDDSSNEWQPFDFKKDDCHINDSVSSSSSGTKLKSLARLIIKNRSTDTQGNKVNWLKIKVLKYEKTEPGVIQFKYNYSDEGFESIRLSGRGRPTKYPDNIKQLYDKPRPISTLKKNDLMELCKTEAIPVEFHEWYQSILSCSKQKDTILISVSENENDN